MSENYKPEISVVRQNEFLEDTWDEDGRCPNAPRALLVRGVPMVGERVGVDGRTGTVIGHRILLDVDAGDVTGLWSAERVAPAPNQDTSEVDRVARAMFEAEHPTHNWDASGWDARIYRGTYRDRARVAIRTMEKRP